MVTTHSCTLTRWWPKNKQKITDHRRGRTCNLLITSSRSQTRCHFARRPCLLLSFLWNTAGSARLLSNLIESSPPTRLRMARRATDIWETQYDNPFVSSNLRLSSALGSGYLAVPPPNSNKIVFAVCTPLHTQTESYQGKKRSSPQALLLFIDIHHKANQTPSARDP